MSGTPAVDLFTRLSVKLNDVLLTKFGRSAFR